MVVYFDPIIFMFWLIVKHVNCFIQNKLDSSIKTYITNFWPFLI